MTCLNLYLRCRAHALDEVKIRSTHLLPRGVTGRDGDAAFCEITLDTCSNSVVNWCNLKRLVG